MRRHHALVAFAGVLVALVAPSAVAGAAADAGEEDYAAYLAANARLAKRVPNLPGARVLVEEQWGGGNDDGARREGVGRIVFLARPLSQRAAIRFHARALGSAWRKKSAYCLVAGRRLVVAFVDRRTRRAGVYIDSRGSPHCDDLTGLVADLVTLGHGDVDP